MHDKVIAAFIAWMISSALIIWSTRKPSKYFTTLTTRMFIAGICLLTATVILNYYTSQTYYDYHNYLTIASDGKRGSLEERALLSMKSLIDLTALFSNIFGASIGGNLIYKAVYSKD